MHEPLGKYAYIKARIGWRGLASSEYTDDGPYLIAGNHIKDGRVNWDECDHISEFRYRESSEIALQERDIVISKDGTIGRVAIITDMPDEATINGTMMLVRARKPLLPNYVYHYLNSNEFQRLVEERISGSSVPHLFQRDMVQLSLPIPNEHEQVAIAYILDSIDAEIRKAQSLIIKLQNLKIGLLHDLLTQGLDKNGNIRNPESDPDEFVLSQLGLIPQNWDTTTLEGILIKRPGAMRSGPFGSSLRKDEFVDAGIPVIGIDNVFREQFVENFTRFITDSKYTELSRYQVFPNDVMITIMGTVGRSCVAPSSLPIAISSKHVWTMTVDKACYLPELLSIQLNYAIWVQAHFMSFTQGSTMPAISSSILKSTPLPLPPIQEQEQILDVYQSLKTSIEAEQIELDKLYMIKSGVMDDLLTARMDMSSINSLGITERDL